MIKQDVLKLKLSKLVKMFPQNDIYLFGESLRNLLSGTKVKKMDIFIHCNPAEKDFIKLKIDDEEFDDFQIHLGSDVDFSSYKFTIDTLKCDVKSLIRGQPEINSHHKKGLEDLEKGLVRINKNDLMENPLTIFETIYVAAQMGFTIESKTMKSILDNKKNISSVPKRYIFNFLKLLFINSDKPRKSVAILNTTGVSSILFDTKLLENSTINHLNQKDFIEFLATVFSQHPADEYFFSSRLGMKEDEIKNTINVIKSINIAVDETEKTARNILNICGKDRITSLVRLFKSMGKKNLSNEIKKLKTVPLSEKELAITEDDIKKVFGCADADLKRAMSAAIEKVMEEPEFNNKSKLMVFLNKIFVK